MNTNLKPPLKALTNEQAHLVLAIVLSVSRRQSDAYLSYVNLTGKSDCKGEFHAAKNELLDRQLICRVNREEDYLYFTADGLCCAVLACADHTYTVQRLMSSSLSAPEGHYARFIASGIDSYFYYNESVSDDLMEQSVNDNLALMSRSNLLWLQVLNSDVVKGYSDYFAATWLTLMTSATNAQTFTSINTMVSSHIKASMPVQIVADLPLFSENHQAASHFVGRLDESYLSIREKLFEIKPNTRLSFSRLIDLFVLQNVQPALVDDLIEQYQALDSFTFSFLGFYHWQKEFVYLQMSDDELVDRYYDAGMWMKSVVGDKGVLWGRLVLDLLQMCRVKRYPKLAAFFIDLAKHPHTVAILASEPTFNLAVMAQKLLKHLADIGTFIDKPDMWRLWMRNVEKVFAHEEGQGSERLVWIISDNDTVTSKIQKLGKKGWSPGRKIGLDRLKYGECELLSENDYELVSCFERTSQYWFDTHNLNKSSLNVLAKSDRVFNEQGEPICIVAEASVLIIGEQDGLLKLARFPSPEKRRSLLTERTSSIYSFQAVSEQLERFFKLSKKLPAVPEGQAQELIELIGNDVQWYSETERHGNIELGEWDVRPHLWLKLDGMHLEISIEHQSQDGALRLFSGRGEAWQHQEGKVWYQRDIAQEKRQAKAIYHALGYEGRRTDGFVARPEQLPELLDAMSTLEDVAVHWHAGSKQVQHIKAENVDLKINQQGDWFGVSGEVVLDGGLVLDLQHLLEARRTGYIEVSQQNLTIMINETLRKQLNLLDSVLNDDLAVNSKMAYPLQKLIESMSVDSDHGWKALENEWSKPITIEPQRLEILRDYQKCSVQWAIHLLNNGFGACLADDMGLGKTLQALKVMEHYSELGPSLVVCPKSVLFNWQQECDRFTPQLVFVDLESSKDRVQALAKAKSGDVVLMSYGLVTRLASQLEAIKWQSVILDEAQQIKNPSAQRTKVLVNLNAERRMTLSGTPVENHLVELWSQFSFLNPGLLGSLKQFKAKYGQASKNEEDMFRLRALVSPFIMRRVKKEVLTELPEKTELVHHIELSPKERSAYEAVRQDSLRISETGEKNSAIKLLAALTRLRQVCCDPHLVFEQMSDTSSKLKEALQLVNEAREGGHKILVFSQFVQLLKRCGALLEEQGIEFSYLDGQSNTKKRKQAIEQFKSGKHDVFLISLKAGGAGLNLTEADTVIHLDPWWNPAVEDQASDRAYRMGQTNPVTVYRLVAINTIEEKIIQLHEEKRNLADKVLSGQSEASHLKPEMLLALLSD